MRKLYFAAGIALTLSGCAATAPQMAWGKPGVSKVDYGTDVGMCTGLAAQKSTNDGNNTAGGIKGRNNTAAGGGSGQASPDSTPSGGSYSGMASSDYAQRAATEQRTQEMAAQRARSEALNSCLVGRGYQQFALTPEQAAHLATLQKGSNEYLQYLYKLGTDAEVVRNQSAPAK